MKKQKLFNRVIAFLLVFAMIFAENNLSVFATEGTSSEEITDENVAGTDSGLLVEDGTEQQVVDGNDGDDVSDPEAADMENVGSEDTDGIIARGSKCGIDWVIDAEGTLTVSGTYTGGEFNDDIWIWRYGGGEYLKCPEWIDYRDDIVRAEIGAKNMQSMKNWFYDCKNLTMIDFTNSDTAQITDMSELFYGCSGLESINFENFDTSNVTNMSQMFWWCGNIGSIDLSNFDTSNVTDMKKMFGYCDSLNSLDLSGFDTSNVTDMSEMFCGCRLLTNIDVSHFNTQNVTDMSNMFCGCEKMTNIDISHFNTQNVTDMSGMFSACGIETLDISKFNTKNVKNMHGMFLDSTELTSVNVYGLDTGNVEDMSWMFCGCTELTSLDVSSFDTSNVKDMDRMFACGYLQYISGSFAGSELLNIDISNFDTQNVTDMTGMFYGCSNLTSLDVSNLDTRNVTKMGRMFCCCSNLTNLDVSNFATHNVTDMENMFKGCSSLTSLEVSNFDMGKITYADSMFENCTALKTIRSFSKLGIAIDLPISPMYDASGNEYTTFPTGLSKGIWLSADPSKVPNDSISQTSSVVGNTNASIVIYDRKTQEAIENATVEVDGTTYSSSAKISIPLSSAQIQKTVIVTADGYYKCTTTPILTQGKVTYIALTPKAAEDAVAITAVDAVYGTKTYKLLEQNMNLCYRPNLDESKLTTEEMLIAVFEEGHVIKYELLQDDEVLQTNTDGRFILNVIKTYDKETYTSPATGELKNKKPLYVRITGADGTQVTEKLGIKISNSYTSVTNQTQKGEFELGKKLKLKVPDDVPLVGGGTLDMGFDKNLPIEVKIDEKGVIKVGVNKPVDQGIDEWEKSYKQYKNMGKEALQRMANGTNQSFGAGYFKITGKVCGYGEGNLSEVHDGKVIISVGILAEMEGKSGYKRYFLAGWVPVYLFVEGKAKVSVDGKGSVSLEDYKLTGAKLVDGAITFKGELTAGGGVGVELLVALKVSVKGTVNYVNKPQRNYEKAWLSASGQVSKVTLVIWEKPYWKSKEYRYTIYEKGVDKDPLSTKSMSSQMNAVYDEYVEEGEGVSLDVAPQVLSRNYLSFADGYQEVALPETVQAVSESASLERRVVKAAVLPSASAKLVQVGKMKYLFWLEDIITRSTMNRAALVYAVSEDGLNWSEPKRLLGEEQSKTLDYGFDLAVAGDKIFVVWQNAEQEYAEDATILDVASGIKTHTAVIDTVSGSVSVLPEREQTAGCYLYPCVYADGDNIYVCYARNDLSSQDVTGNNKYEVYFDSYAQGSLTDSKTIALPENYQIFSMTMGMFGGKLCAICDMDTDGDNTTSDDREIVLIQIDDSTVAKLTDNNAADCSPVLTDAGVLYWNSADGVKKLSNSGADAVLVTDAINAFTNYSFEVASSDGKDWIIYESNSSEGDTLSVYGIGQQADGTYGNPVEFGVITGNIISELSGTGDDDNIYLAGLEGDFLQDGTLLQDLCVYRIGDQTDLSVEEVTYEEAAAEPGKTLPLTVTLYNKGNIAINEAVVQVDGQTIATLSDLKLEPGESRTIDVDGYVIPDSVSKPEEHILSVMISDDTDTENNKQAFTVGYPDFAVETETRYSGEHTWVDISVSNSSKFASSGTVLIHKATEDGEVIFRKAFSKLSSEEVWNCTVSLADYEAEDVRFYVEVVSDQAENFVGNNEEFLYIGYGTGIDPEEEESESVELTGISLSKKNTELTVGDTEKLSLSTQPAATLPASEFLWESSNARVASVDDEGNVKALMAGTTNITVYYGDLSASCEVTVTGNALEPITILLDSQESQRFAPIAGIMPGSKVNLPTPENVEKKIFLGWYTEAEGGTKITVNSVLYQSMTLYGHWIEAGENLWVMEVPDQVYTGAAIKPSVLVYDGVTLLTEKVDYSVSYKNNVNVNDASVAKTAPIITVTGKGNYSGKETVNFVILPKSIKAEEISVSAITAAANNKVQKPIPVVTYNGKRLTNKKDFTVSYPDAENDPDAYKKAGTYRILITGINNFKEEREVTFTITDSVMLTKAKIGAIPKQQYTGRKIEPDISVTLGKEKLDLDTDYEVSYADNILPGKATVTITGKGKYAGTKTVQFNIIGTSLAKAAIDGIENKVYNGEEQTLSLSVKLDGKDLKETQDYEVSYGKNENTGTASVTIKGIGGYTGSVKKTFKILPYDLSTDEAQLLEGVPEKLSVAYTKGGCTPDIELTFAGNVLTAKKDYTISYANNKSVTVGVDSDAGNANKAVKTPTITIKGKGNFKGSISIPFAIVQKDLQDTAAPVTIQVADIAYVNKAGKYISKPVLIDSNGKKLVAGTDYEKEIVYTLDDGTTLDATSIVDVNREITVTVTGKGCYKGTLEATYRITEVSFAKAKITVAPQIYTGSEIQLQPADITVKLGKETLALGEEYEIVPGSYRNNTKKGTASVTIRGVGKYGGEKTVKFKITAKKFVWFWRLLQ